MSVSPHSLHTGQSWLARKLFSSKPRQLAGVISIVVGGSNCWRIQGERSLLKGDG
ncbi:MAG: hypothetical protein KME55_27815 [Nostoc indistinguendum CM1-VF10]|nr:hypothetical protein [Nostoc indistinguendum CM1-VF10]